MSAILTGTQIRASFIKDASATADLDELGYDVDALLAALRGVPAATAGADPTNGQVSYTHRTHRGDAICAVRAHGELELPVGPIVSVTSVTVNGVALAEGTDFTVDHQARRLVRVGYPNNGWPPDYAAIEVEYIAGFDDIQNTARQVYRLSGQLARHLWVRGGSAGRSNVELGGLGESTPLALIPDAVIDAAVKSGLVLPRGMEQLWKAARIAKALAPSPTGAAP